MLNFKAMRCIIVDDEPLARNAIQRHITDMPELTLIGHFSSTANVGEFLQENDIDLIFLDIEMPGVNGIDFARTIPQNTMVIFTTAYPQYALDSYEVDAVDYLVKPIESERFHKAVNKAISYHSLLEDNRQEVIENIESEYIFVKSDKRFSKVYFKDILFIEGLKDYVIIQTQDKRIITRMYLKIIHEHLPAYFFRVNKSHIVNIEKIESFDNNDLYLASHEIAIGNTYRESLLKILHSKVMYQIRGQVLN